MTEKNQDNVWSVGYIYLGGQMVAEYKNGTTYFAHGDHLGSTRVATKVDKTMQASYDLMPYGESSNPDTTITHKFTGLERDSKDSEPGLDDTWFRKYSALCGRWLSPDPLFGSPSDPQSLNRYAYVLNDPVNLIDPLGLQCQDQEFLGFIDVYDWENEVWYSQWQIQTWRSCGPQRFGGDRNGGPGGNGQAQPPAPQPQQAQQQSLCNDPKYRNAVNFISANLGYAQQIAQGLNTTTANVLGHSGLESTYGTSPIARNNNNYFGLTVGRQFGGTIGNTTTPDGRTFGVYPAPGFLTSGLSFAGSVHGQRVAGTTNPEGYAAALTTRPQGATIGAFNSEPGYAQLLAKVINLILRLMPCATGTP